ncbi:MAG: ACP S-malonyltransferase [Chloroflexota bacterium]
MTIDYEKSAFIFPGQGSQVVGMGQNLNSAYSVAKDLFENANAILGINFTEVMWSGPEAELNDTINTQPALFIHSLAVFRVFKSLYPESSPRLVAGHSLGQLSAITAAGVLSFEDGLRLVRKRGELMKRAGEISPGGMAAILNLDIPALEKVCAEASNSDEFVQVANDNCPGQVVISGHKPALERAMVAAKLAGAKRALPLAVSIAAHSPLMDSIQKEWDQAVDAATFNPIVIPIVGNVSATVVNTVEGLRLEVKSQMQSRVRWTESIKWMSAQGISTYIEVGSGSVLGGLVKRIAEGVITLQIGTPLDFEIFS